MLDRLYHCSLRQAGADELLIYPVLELDGIIDANPDQYRKCRHRDHGEWYLEKAHGAEGPAHAQKDDWDGKKRPSHLREGHQQCHYHQKARQEKNRSIALGHLSSYRVHQGGLAGESEPGIGRKAGQLQLAVRLLMQLLLLRFCEGDWQLYGEHGMAAIRQYRRQYGTVSRQDLSYSLLIRNGPPSAALFLPIGHNVGDAGDGEDARCLLHPIGEEEHPSEYLRLCHIIRLDQYGDGLSPKVLHIEVLVDLVEAGVLAHHALSGQSLHLDLLGIVDGDRGEKQSGNNDQNGVLSYPSAKPLCAVHNRCLKSSVFTDQSKHAKDR